MTKKVHLQNGPTRSPCRYTARPDRRVLLLTEDQFGNAPMESRCGECQAVFQQRQAPDTRNFAAGLSRFLGMS